MKPNVIIKRTLVALSFSCTTFIASAQNDDLGLPGPDPDPTPSGTEVPIDLGLSLFVAAGIGYAAKRKYNRRLQKQNEA